ncbi:hypothetical protein CWC13_19565, partial [Pseudoalteromonas ruthenica]
DDSALKNYYDSTKKQYELIEEEITFTLEDIQNNDAANTNAQAHAFMLSYVMNSSRVASQEYQRIERAISLTYNNNTAEEFVVFDEQSPDYEGLTRSVTNYLTSIAEDGTIVGW